MKPRRRSPRPGRHLSAVKAIGIVRACPELSRQHDALTARGFTLKATVRPYYAVCGWVSFTFVWRRRAAEDHTTYRVTWRVPLHAFLRETA